jgi:hypothetical protein
VPILTLLSYAEIALCIAVLAFLLIGEQRKTYWALGSFLAVRAASGICLLYLHGPGLRWLGPAQAYRAYFGTYWVSFAMETVLEFLILYSLFRLIAGPLRGLLKLGTLIFRWAAVISIAMAAFTFAHQRSGPMGLVVAVSQLQRAVGMLSLLLAILLWPACRSLGLSLRSRVAGVSAGLALMGANDFIQATGLTLNSGRMHGYSLVNGALICFILLAWSAYFALPEPERSRVGLAGPLQRLNLRCLRWYSD